MPPGAVAEMRMNSRLFVCFAALVLQACDKAEEKPVRNVVSGPPPVERTSPAPATTPAGPVDTQPAAGATVPTAPAPPAAPAPPPPPPPTPPTQEQLDTYYASVDAFVKEATPAVEADTLTDETRNELRTKLVELTTARGRLMRGMTTEERKAMVARLAPLVKLQAKILNPVIPGLPELKTPPAASPNNAAPASGDEGPPP